MEASVKPVDKLLALVEMRNRFKAKEKALTEKLNNDKHDLYVVRRQRQRQADEAYTAGHQLLVAKYDQDLAALDAEMEKEIEKLKGEKP